MHQVNQLQGANIEPILNALIVSSRIRWTFLCMQLVQVTSDVSFVVLKREAITKAIWQWQNSLLSKVSRHVSRSEILRDVCGVWEYKRLPGVTIIRLIMGWVQGWFKS